jgi:hypothetical protein
MAHPISDVAALRIAANAFMRAAVPARAGFVRAQEAAPRRMGFRFISMVLEWGVMP